MKLLSKTLIISAVIFYAVNTIAYASQTGGRVFLTFDDGPINATLNILDQLKSSNARATFFINAHHLHSKGGEAASHAAEALQRIIEEGHIIGNHSYDHMSHNNRPFDAERIVVGTYKQVDKELPYFEALNRDPVKKVLGDAYSQPNNLIEQLVRLPYTNNWRLPGLTIDCPCCTLDKVDIEKVVSPTGACPTKTNSSTNAIKLADHFAKHNMHVFGWDVHWGPINWAAPNVSETLQPVDELIDDIEAAFADKSCATEEFIPLIDCQAPPRNGKVIVLVHDFLFENSYRGKGKDVNLAKISTLIDRLREKGYTLDTLDNYLQ